MAIIDSVVKILVAGCVSLACLVYAWEAYQRYESEKRAKAQCEFAMQFEELNLLHAKPDIQVGGWAALQYCLTRARFNDGPSD